MLEQIPRIPSNLCYYERLLSRCYSCYGWCLVLCSWRCFKCGKKFYDKKALKNMIRCILFKYQLIAQIVMHTQKTGWPNDSHKNACRRISFNCDDCDKSPWFEKHPRIHEYSTCSSVKIIRIWPPTRELLRWTPDIRSFLRNFLPFCGDKGWLLGQSSQIIFKQL